MFGKIYIATVCGDFCRVTSIFRMTTNFFVCDLICRGGRFGAFNFSRCITINHSFKITSTSDSMYCTGQSGPIQSELALSVIQVRSQSRALTAFVVVMQLSLTYNPSIKWLRKNANLKQPKNRLKLPTQQLTRPKPRTQTKNTPYA